MLVDRKSECFNLANKLLYYTTSLLCTREGGGGGGSKKFYPQIEQFQHYLNKLNGNIFLTDISDLFPSSASKFFFLPM